MIAIPAIDIREGACVQLVGGSFDDERVRIADPCTVMSTWLDAGFRRVHVVDLDAALGVGGNDCVARALLADRRARVQVGGGVRTTERADQLVAAGADRVVVGTRAVEDPEWLDTLSRRHPDRIIVALDVRGRTVLTHGWAFRSTLQIEDAMAALEGLPLGGVLVTAVHREGRLEGTDVPLVSDVVGRARIPVIASGGIATMDDLRSLESAGAAAAVIGMALYTGALDPRAVQEEFHQ
ncbi:MAG TPA: 1-(5-phosphoribosyl)-5-[(5-phosphoribosylamino)methylideneamino] imidazole-4-carboxamide isomerase [Gemmatimonadaceae bacterium]|nr:1-(5-phosphoribosyl)-5-[(5-phosphoribosylamino)methylideneamino] imidazole-4-carboxamide isomerase [Gemmatimonadaceae bacterium]